MRIENISEDLLTEIKFDKNYKPTDPKNSVNPPHKKHEGNYTKARYN